MVPDLELRIDARLPQVKQVPRLEPRACRQRLGTDVNRVPAGMVVEDDDVVGSAAQEPACSGGDLSLHLRSTLAPVRRIKGEDGSPVVQLGDPLHVGA